MTTCGIWYSGTEYYNLLTNGEVQTLTKNAAVSPDNTQQLTTLTFENSNSTTHTLNTCAFDGTHMYAVGNSNMALYRIQKRGNFTASLYTRDSGFSRSTIIPLTNWKDNNNCVYLVNSTGIRPECGNSTNSLKVINDSTLDYVNFGTAVAAFPNAIYRLDSGSQLSTITILNNTASVIRRSLQPPLRINTMENVTVSLSTDNSNLLVYEKSSGLVQVIKSINSSNDQTLATDQRQISDNSAVGATFQNSDLIIAMTGARYNAIETSSFFTPNNTVVSPYPVDSASSSGRYIDPAVAGGFTVLGLVLGALVVIAIILIRRCFQRRRNKKILIPNEEIFISGDKEMLSDRSPTEEIVVTQYNHLPRSNVNVTMLNGPSLEANPIQTSISPIFLAHCNIQDFGAAQHNSNPQFGTGIYLRECTYNGKPGLIHYMSSDNRSQFEKFVQVMHAIRNLPQTYTSMLELYDAYQFSHPTEDDYRIQYVLVTSYYEVKESLAHLYKRYRDGSTVVNVKDEVFVICTIYSLLQSVRNIHSAGYAHRCLSMSSFYAESYAPTLDWVLSDFQDAVMNTKPTEQLPDFQKDIYDLGGIIYTVISGGRSFSDDRNRGLINNIIEEVTRNQKYQNQYRRILDASLNRDMNQRYSADQLVKLWESFFDFKN